MKSIVIRDMRMEINLSHHGRGAEKAMGRKNVRGRGRF
jgi:hypothetical protein